MKRLMDILMHCRKLPEAFYESREAAAGLDRSRLAAEIVNTLLEETKELKLPDEYIQHNMVPGREICISDGNSIRRKHWKSARMDV